MIRLAPILVLFIPFGCSTPAPKDVPIAIVPDTLPRTSEQRVSEQYIYVQSDVSMDHYFEALDTLCDTLSNQYGTTLDEYALVHANPRLIDSLMAQDYYRAKSRGVRIENQRDCIILKAGDSLRIPSASEIMHIQELLSAVRIDVNIPEYTLRIWVRDSLVHQCLVRVGKNERKYLELAKHEVNLRTPIGEGHIIRIERDPLYMNPVDGHRYEGTWRDDGHYTGLPRIPFLEPEINSIRSGALIHPTTNRRTLGKAISNGCVGLSEADAWMVYYYAPLGTRVRFRYDLVGFDTTGKKVEFKDIYNLKSMKGGTSNDHLSN
jgi:L,D-transpeptidase ErfK/SrfK